MTESEAKRRIIEIAAGIGVALLGTAGAYYLDQPGAQELSVAAAVGSGAYTVKNIFNYVSKLG